MPLGDLRGLGEQRIPGGLEVGGGAVDLHPDRRADADERGHLGGDRERVADGGPRLQARRHADHGDAVAAGVLADRAAGRRDDPPRADRLGGGVAAERLLGVARVAGAEDRAVGRRPGGDAVAADDVERLAQAGPERGGGKVAADRRAAHPADEQPGRLEAARSSPRRRARGRRGGSPAATAPHRADRRSRRRRSARRDRVAHAVSFGCTRAPGSSSASAEIVAPAPITEP